MRIGLGVAGALGLYFAYLLVTIAIVPRVQLSNRTLSPDEIPQGVRGTVAFVNVEVVPMDREVILEDHTVVVENGHIVEVGSSATVAVPEDATVVDGAGRYLVPGLSDMHVHLQQTPNDLLLYLANGVTTIRELTGRADELGWRDQIAHGERIGPRMWVASSKAKQVWEPDLIRKVRYALFGRSVYQSAVINSADAADEFIQDLISDGYDYVKISSRIRPDIYRAVLDAARRHGLPAVGHVPNDVPIDEFMASGQVEITHVEELLGEAVLNEVGGIHENTREALEAAIGDVARRTAAAGFWVTTTLTVGHGIAEQAYHLDEVLARPEVRYVDPWWRGQRWVPDANPYLHEPDDPRREEFQKLMDEAARYQDLLAKALHDAGVPLMAGTDASAPAMVPGFSLHDELAYLVAAGLTPYEALETTTVNPARFLGRESEMGTIAAGKRADLLLLTANPLEDIAATRDIAGVMVDGRWLDRSDLDAMLAAITDRNG